MGVVLIKCAWPKIFVRVSRALLLQPHHCNNPRSAPEYAVSREPVGERTSDGGLVGSEGGYRVRRGCYFLPLDL